MGPGFDGGDRGVVDPLAGHDEIVEAIHGGAPAGAAAHVLIEEDAAGADPGGGGEDDGLLKWRGDVVDDVDDADDIEQGWLGWPRGGGVKVFKPQE